MSADVVIALDSHPVIAKSVLFEVPPLLTFLVVALHVVATFAFSFAFLRVGMDGVAILLII